jgi:hypothetical protein
LWFRLLHDAAGAARDPRLGTEIGRLCAAGRMTATEATAAFRVAEVYGRYERMDGLNRSCRSPSYEIGYGGGGEKTERDPEVVKAWHELQSHIPTWPPTRRRDLETLAVENRCIGPMELNEVRSLLQQLAVHFRITSASRNSPQVQRPIRPAVKKKSTADTKLPRSEIERRALRHVLTLVNIEFQSSEIDTYIELFFTFRERELFRAEKAGKGG